MECGRKTEGFKRSLHSDSRGNSPKFSEFLSQQRHSFRIEATGWPSNAVKDLPRQRQGINVVFK